MSSKFGICLTFFFIFTFEMAFSQARLGFEEANAPLFTENNHQFEIKTDASENFSKEGIRSWHCNEKNGNYGSLKVINGSLSLRSFWVRRPWGSFDALVKGLKNGIVKYEKEIEIGTTFEQIVFENWTDIDEIVLESGKKYNQFYVDELEYDFVGTANLLTQSTENTQNAVDLLRNLPPVLPADSEGKQLYLLDFEDIPKQESFFVANQHHFQFASTISDLFAKSGLTSWQLNEKEGNKGELKMVTGLFNVQSFWVRRPWGNFEAVIRAFRGDEEIYKKNISVTQNFEKIELDWKNIDKIEVYSVQKFNQIYIDDLLYSLSDQKDGVRVAQTNPKILDKKELLLDFEGEVLDKNTFVENAHYFRISSQIFDKQARNGLFCWQANDVNGNFGFLEITSGSFDVHSLWIKRPWGIFEAIIKAYDNENLLHTQSVLVNSEYQEVHFENWKKIKRITVESTQKFNQLYIDQVAYNLSDSNAVFEEEKAQLTVSTNDSFALKILREQEITVKGIENKAFGDPKFEIFCQTSSGKHAQLKVVDGALQQIDEQFFQITGVGKATLLVSVEGDNLYKAAEKMIELDIKKSKQRLQVDSIPDLFPDSSYQVHAAASSGLEAHIKVLKGNVKIFGNTIIPQKNTGKVKLQILQEGNEFYEAADPIEVNFKVIKKKNLEATQVQKTPILENQKAKKQRQSLVIEALTEKYFTDSDFELHAKSSVGLPIKWQVVSGNAQLIPPNILHLSGTGLIKLKATAQANEHYFSTSQECSFWVKKAAQQIDFEPISEKLANEKVVEIKAKASSNLPVSLILVSGAAKIVQNKVHLLGQEGEIVVKAIQKGNLFYEKTSTEIRFQVVRKIQSIDFEKIENKNFGENPFMLSAKTSSGLPVSFKILKGLAQINDNYLSLEGGDSIEIEAYQLGNEEFKPISVKQSFYVANDLHVQQHENRWRHGEQTKVEFSASDIGQNEFELQISDSRGLFEKPQILAKTNATERAFRFVVPQIAYGTQYRLRVVCQKLQLYGKASDSQVVISFSHQNPPQEKADFSPVSEEETSVFRFFSFGNLGKFAVELNEKFEKLDFFVYDQNDELVYSRFAAKMPNFRDDVDISELAKGVYTIKLQTEKHSFEQNYEKK